MSALPSISERLAHKLQSARASLDRAKELAGGGCDHSWGSATFVLISTNGERLVYKGCARCETPQSNWLPASAADGDAPVADDRRCLTPPCCVCGAFGTELHHWAPRSIFKDEAEHWPTAWLCRPCHQRWHQTTGLALGK